MAKTLSDAQTEVRIYLDEASQLDFKDTEVTIAVNRAYHDVAGAVMEVNERFYETITPFTYAIVSNQQEYTIDSTIIKVTRVEINYNPTSTGSVSSRAVPINEDEVRGNLANTNNAGSFFSAGYFLHGDIGNQTIGFVPVPQTSDTTGKNISVWGIAIPSDLVNTTDKINIPWVDRFVYLVSLKAASQLLRKGQQEEAFAARYLSEYEIGKDEMQQFLKDRQADDGQFIIDSQLEQIDFSTLEVL